MHGSLMAEHRASMGAFPLAHWVSAPQGSKGSKGDNFGTCPAGVPSELSWHDKPQFTSGT